MNNIFTKICFITIITMLSFSANAQDPGGDGGLQELPEAAPISNYLPLAMVVGVVLGYVLLRKKLTNVK